MIPAPLTWWCLRRCLSNIKEELVQARVLMVAGRLQIDGKAIHVLLNTCFDSAKMYTNLVHPAKWNRIE
ncbi:MAG: hypothetical protein LH478_15735 [Chitinophagaceae bacterium]|nr:hypothetical protein [Chitinophagaceae bacterium]